MRRRRLTRSCCNYYQPQLLLGLTATPERMDGKNILTYFNNRIAAEIRLPEAIDRKLLCPFQYFGVTDTVDLNDLRWSPGGYDKGELSQSLHPQRCGGPTARGPGGDVAARTMSPILTR